MPIDMSQTLGFDESDREIVEAREDVRDYEALIDSLVRIRKSKKITQSAVAVAMGTTQSAVSDFERLGGDARVSTIQRYARAVGERWQSQLVEPRKVDAAPDTF